MYSLVTQQHNQSSHQTEITLHQITLPEMMNSGNWGLFLLRALDESEDSVDVINFYCDENKVIVSDHQPVAHSVNKVWF